MKVRAFHDYKFLDTPACGGFSGVTGEVVRVTGFAQVNGERWCRVRFNGDKVSKLLAHPSSFEREIA